MKIGQLEQMVTEFKVVSDEDLLKATLFNRCRLSEGGCWEWRKTSRAGYGLFYKGNRYYAAHRISYETFVGPIPEGLHILHSCDNPGCINPDHLRPGTVKENMADREARGRRDVKGEQIGTSKVDALDVLEIRASKLTLEKLGEKYGLSATHVGRIRAGESWAHLPLTGVSYGY